MTLRALLVAGLALGLAAPAAAQYSIDWYTIDGGGGTSTGGDYRLDGTIGQPDAGRASGGGYELIGGFWAIVPGSDTPIGDVESDYMFIGSPAEETAPEHEVEAEPTETADLEPETPRRYEIAEVRITFAGQADDWSLY